MDAIESFPGVDFDSNKLCTAAESSLLQTSSENVNIKDDAYTPYSAKDGQSLETMFPVVYPSNFNFKQNLFLIICPLFLGGGGGSVVLDHLNFFKYTTSSMFKDEVSYSCLF